MPGGERREPIPRVHFPLQLRRSLEQLGVVLSPVRRRYHDADLLRLKSRLGGRRRVPDGERREPIQLVQRGGLPALQLLQSYLRRSGQRHHGFNGLLDDTACMPRPGLVLCAERL